MDAQQQDLPLPATGPSGVTIINPRCSLRAQAEHRVVVVAGLPVHHYSADDAVAAAYAMVFLVDAGYATQREVAVAFGCSERTVRRHQNRYHDGGMAALAARSGWRAGRRRVPTKRMCVMERLRAEGVSNREIARRLGISESAVRQQIGPSRQELQRQQLLPLADSVSLAPDPPKGGGAATTHEILPTPARSPTDARIAEFEPTAMSLDVDPSDRTWDRLLACFGLLDDAKPVFGSAKAVPGAGVLCAVPVLVASGVFDVARTVYGGIGPAFYGLRTTLLTLLLMALWRIKRPEALKEHDPQTLGRVLGLDRAPEVKTIRRKLTRLAAYYRAEQFGAALARLRVQRRGQLLGFLYVDGHVRAYHGKRTIPKAHIARMRLSMPATTDYWVNDQAGDPLFVMTAPANAGLVKMLPEVLGEVRRLVGDRRVTVVFDRGGWSPKLFKTLLEANFDILTYRKGRCRRIGVHRFVLRSTQIDGREVEYRLHDQAARFLKGTLRLRQVTRLTDDGHQTPVITSRWDLEDIEVAYRMFERWRQENFFKYLCEEFLLDALVDYQVEPDEPTRTVPNPERRAMDKAVRAARAEVARLEQAYGAAAMDNPEGRRPTMRGFKIAHGTIGRQLRVARDRLAALLEHRRGVPNRIEVREVNEGAVVKLATERKHLTNLVKMLAYQAESDLLAFLRPQYARIDDEGRTLLHELFRAQADLDVTDTELRVTIGPLSSPHRTLAVQALCKTLTETETLFPGSRLTMRFASHAPRHLGMAFPGHRPRSALAPAPSPPAPT
jgi:DNA-binding CsgD family transcriptional regulator